MSAGRKVTVVFTQAEAQGLLSLRDFKVHHEGAEMQPAEARAIRKVEHQLAAVRGKVGAA